MERGRNMFGQSPYSSFQSFYGTPSFGQQPPVQVGPCAAVDTTPFPTVSDVFYGGGDGGSVATGPHRLGYPGYDSFQPADTDFQPPYFPPPNPAAAQPVGGTALFAHHRQVPVTHQQSLQPVVDQSMYWSPINAAAVYTTGASSANVHAANVDQQKTYHALQQVQVGQYKLQLFYDARILHKSVKCCYTFYRAMHYSAKRGIAIAYLTVTLVDCDHIGWKSWKLIAWTISPTPSLFVAQTPFIYRGTWGLQVRWEKWRAEAQKRQYL